MASIEEIFRNDSEAFLENAKSNDYFADLLNQNWWKILCLTISCLGIIASPLVLLSIIWFERYGNDINRTVLNMFVSLYCWTVIEFVILVQIPETIRLLFGPLPAFLCSLQAYFRASIVTVMLLYKNASMLLRYIFIFWLKNPAAFKDEFWCQMILNWVHMCSLLFHGTEHLITTKMPITYFICIGKEPHNTGQPKFGGITEPFSIIVHIFVYTRISLFKKSIKEGNSVQANEDQVEELENR